jgi:acetylornithine deacetylase/succinyl-diaminopimelate desuccinylase-like protein
LQDMTTKAAQIIEEHLDRAYLIETLSRLAKVPTQVPLGTETYMEPDDPKLVHYVQEVVRPELVRQGEYDLLDVPRNNLVAQVGRGETGRSLLVMNYTPVQHNNLMEDPFSGKVASARAYGVDEPAVFGQGVSQSKAHQAVMLAILRMLRSAGVQLGGKLYWGINNEGRSSHSCSDAILDALATKPDFGIVQLSTGLRISVGNRGRVDVLVHVEGKASHSSMPGLGHSAIEGAHEVITRLRKLEWTDAHPLLGRRHALVYKIRYWPLAPHTLPSDAYLTIDRRLIPGDDPELATEEVRNAIGDLSPFRVTVERGPVMLPALVEVDNPWVAALQDAVNTTRGTPGETVHGQGTFDAGGPCARGVPTVMFGSGGGVWPLGIDYVPVSAVVTEAKALALLILSQLS